MLNIAAGGSRLAIAKPIFTPAGDHKNDHWLVDERREFSIFPKGITDDVTVATPIILSVGEDKAFGVQHIIHKHANWVKRATGTVTVTPEIIAKLVYDKLGQSGTVHCCEERQKLKVNLTIRPSALLVLKLVTLRSGEDVFSVTTLYTKNDRVDGAKLGHYPGRKQAYEMMLSDL